MALLVLRSVGVVCRAKPNVPLVRWQKNKKMCVGQKLNLCLVSLSARFFCPFGLGSVVRYHCCQRSHAWRSCGISEHKTVNPALKPNWKTELEYKHVTPHDAKRVLAVVLLFSLCPKFNCVRC